MRDFNKCCSLNTSCHPSVSSICHISKPHPTKPAHQSRLNFTLAGTVFTEAGVRVTILVDARALSFVATRCEWSIIFDAAKRASLRVENGVVPVCASTQISYSL